MHLSHNTALYPADACDLSKQWVLKTDRVLIRISSMQFHKLLYILFVLVDPLLNQTLQYVSILFAAVVEGIVTNYHCANSLVRLTGYAQRSMRRV